MKSNLCLDCVWVDNSLPSHTFYPLILHAAHEHSSSLYLPIIYSLNHCKYIQKKSCEIKLAHGKKCIFHSRVVAL